MAKKEYKEEYDSAKEAIISDEMIKSCKAEIAKFGFNGDEYINFLISVWAMKNKDTATQFPNTQIDRYREKFIKQHEYSISDNFALDKYKIKTSDVDGKKYETGWFCPRSFWDYILSAKTN